MFFKKKKADKEIALLSPMSGTIIELDQVADPVFAEKVLGDGAAVIPSDGKVVSPVDGTIGLVADTFHALGIQADSGLEVLLHIGINTVELQGKYFDCKIKQGDKVKAGDVLCYVDIEKIKEAGYETCTPILLTNMEIIEKVSVHTGNSTAGVTTVIEVEKK